MNQVINKLKTTRHLTFLLLGFIAVPALATCFVEFVDHLCVYIGDQKVVIDDGNGNAVYHVATSNCEARGVAPYVLTGEQDGLDGWLTTQNRPFECNSAFIAYAFSDWVLVGSFEENGGFTAPCNEIVGNRNDPPCKGKVWLALRMLAGGA